MTKRHLVERVVPLLIELRRLLSAKKHPALGAVTATTAAMLREYKGEVEEILAMDRQIAKEILFDVKQFELALKGGAHV
eukprot:CAMPEP_0175087166 /NCGR_PEP_ID=MMETSP0052_2-20121109/29677_1 /TAXON_ID=51329 ORGANISM="Polytomella parva, Strain SAG 63-3" /NCGR_SAMPLE_ID=MMETSP0052_2 /ASSEMBLY_ACC=CAM_ASM_000194 /LENGTH=78 /DNA_ID=CAMNT_0016359477 /DNA_START=75 /DNA_END=311 /DNA_ORIENTATION=-